MMPQLQVTLCCAFLLVASVSARPQVWNIGFNPNSPVVGDDSAAQPQIDQNTISSTAAPAVQTTPPSRAYFDCLARCPTTSEYNPICGSDAVNYHNMGRLQCAVRCGTSVTAVRSGTCNGL